MMHVHSLQSLLDIFEETPTDSVEVTKRKNIVHPILTLAILFMGVFTTSFLIFPGSFRSPIEVATQFLNTETMQLLELSEPEYSESGAVFFHDDDIPLPKTLISVGPYSPPPDEQESGFRFLGTIEDL